MILLLLEGPGMSSSNMQLVMFGLIFAVMYFFIIRPQIKKQKQESAYRLALQKGDSVITIGGIHGKIIDVKNDAFIIEVHGGTKLKVQKTAVSMSGETGIEQK